MSQSLPLVALFSLFAVTYGQQVGNYTAEVNPRLVWEKCTFGGSCKPVNGAVTIDANYRWTHQVGGYSSCRAGSGWDPTICPDPITCAKNCAVEGVDYASSGVATSGNALTVTLNTATNSGPRIYLLAPDLEKYEMFKVKQQEFTFDVDLHEIGCGNNAALYFSEMDVHGGKAKTNKAGPMYGTGYCDAQCPTGDNFINGQANFNSSGFCCNEMDLWEANAISNAFTTHGCQQNGPYTCQGTGCQGQCDGNGCAFNAYGVGEHDFYGPGKTVDTNKKFTVVTQFLTDNGFAWGNLAVIRRIYVQNGKVIQNTVTKIPGVTPTNAISTKFCDQQFTATNSTNGFAKVGGLKPLDTAFETGMVLAISLWDDPSSFGMNWLDGAPNAGTCTTGPVVSSPTINATFSNIKFGDIGSTYPSGWVFW